MFIIVQIMAREIWQDPRTIEWVEAQSFILSKRGVAYVVDGRIALRHRNKGSSFELTTRRSSPIIRESQLENEESIRRYMEHDPEDPRGFVTLNYKLTEGTSMIVAGYRIKGEAIISSGLYLGVAADHEANIWAVQGNVDPKLVLQRLGSRARYR